MSINTHISMFSIARMDELEARLVRRIEDLFAEFERKHRLQVVTNAGEHKWLSRKLVDFEEAVATQKFLLWKLETGARAEIERLRTLEAMHRGGEMHKDSTDV